MTTTAPDHGFKQLFVTSIIMTIVLSVLAFILLPGPGAHPMAQSMGIVIYLLIVVPGILCVLICGTCLLSGRGKVLPLAGMMLTIFATFTFMVRMIIPVQDVVIAIPLFAGLYAIACTFLTLLALVRLPKQYQWVFKAASLVIFGFATLVAWKLPNDPAFDGVFYMRVALGLVLAVTVFINVLALAVKSGVGLVER